MALSCQLQGSILAFISSDTDFAALGEIVRPRGALVHRGRGVADVCRVHDGQVADVIVTETTLADEPCWKNVLNAIERSGTGQPLIVASRLADEFLWAEVLNLGGFDLLSEPFDPEEVLRVFGGALRERFRKSVHQRAAGAAAIAVGLPDYKSLTSLRAHIKRSID